jgi:hypothetical protein
MLGWPGAVSIKSAETCYLEHVFLHRWDEGHAAHSGASEP